ncbi:MAG: AMP-binding protein, partial [Clostridia bacterium]|nr:AMP-binding protein [Clostridia bacterium]
VGALGKPGYNWQAKIVKEDMTEAGNGVTGELAVKGNGVMKCYYKNPEATAEVLRDGWLLTGDMAYKDDDGFIYIVDRKKDLIITGGENIFPVEIENYLRANDKIKDAGVIGLPDDRLGEIVAAVIELKDGATSSEEEMAAYCEGLPRYKRPRRYFFEKVPRNPTGKIEKVVLRERYCKDTLVNEQLKR